MKITFLQTADPLVYREMLDVTSKSLIAYCALHDAEYHMFVGIVRGAKPWHASLNRVPLIQRLVDAGHSGWVVYVDADAYVKDLGFDLHAYLNDRQDYLMIATPSGANPDLWWDVNIGVFALNLGHPLARELLSRWQAKFDAVADERLFSETVWGEVLDDQQALHACLQEMVGAEAGLLRDHEVVFNWEGRFIAQVVRDARLYTRASRLAELRGRVAQVLGESVLPPDLSAEQQARKGVYDEFVTTLYRVFFGRPPDAGGRDAASERLYSGERYMDDEVRSCMASPEGRAWLPHLLRQLFEPGELERLRSEL